MNKKYLILTGSFWDWHNAAKNWIKNHLEEKWEIVKVFDFANMLKSKQFSQSFYKFCSEKYPILRKGFFKIVDLHSSNIIAKKYFTWRYSKEFDNMVNDFNPDYIISVFPISQYFVWHHKENHKLHFKYWVVITDSSIPLPWYFEDKYIDKFFVIDDYAKNDLSKKLPHRKDDVITTFFPIEEKYFFDKLNLNNKIIAILLTWFPYEFCKRLLAKLIIEDFYEKIIIIKWRNDYVYNKIENEINDERYKYTTYLNIKDELKNIDIFISKPGWAIVSECIAQDTYMITPYYIEWQEKENIDFLEKYNLWFHTKSTSKIINFLKAWYKEIKLDIFKKIKNKDAIKDIINNL